MKKLLALIICISIFSCSKEPITDPPNPEPNQNGSIEYKVNGNLVVMDNVDISTGQYVVFAKQLKGIVPETRYLLNAQKGVNNVVIMTIVTDSLHLINYHYDYNTTIFIEFAVLYNGQNGTIFLSGDYFDVNITGYQNSTISGTFTAKLTPYSSAGTGPPGSMVITEGVMNNIPVTY